MGGSAAEAPTLPDGQPVKGLRASDAERDEAIAKLSEEFAAGRLSHHTFIFRMHAVLEARHLSDLPPLLADLPAPAPPAGGPAPGESAPAALAPGGPAPASPEPAPPESAAPSAPGAPVAATPSPRRGLARRLTSGMARGRREKRRPAPLEFPRDAGPAFSIGRDAACDLAIDDITVSRLHARLERMPDGWLLTDLDSTNGTRVNGWRVRGQVPVRVGDLVSFGRADFCLGEADGV